MCHDVPSVIPERFVIASEPLAVGFELFRMSSPYRSDVPFVSDDGFPFLVSSARAVVEQKPEIFAGPGHIYVESQFLRRVKIFRIVVDEERRFGAHTALFDHFAVNFGGGFHIVLFV